MYKLCKTEQSAARQRELENGLLTAMESHGYEEITISDLCDQMRIPRKSFYRYFSSKDGALHALLDHTLLEFDQLSDMWDGANPVKIRTELEKFFAYWLQQKRLLDALERSGLSGLLVQRANTRAMEESASAAPFGSRDLKGHAVTFTTTGLMSMVIEWHHSGYRQSVQDMAQLAAVLLTRPLVPAIDG